jgi:hypothetical protein
MKCIEGYCEEFLIKCIDIRVAPALSTGLGLLLGAAAMHNYERKTRYAYYVAIMLWIVIVVLTF